MTLDDTTLYWTKIWCVDQPEQGLQLEGALLQVCVAARCRVLHRLLGRRRQPHIALQTTISTSYPAVISWIKLQQPGG